MSSIKRHKVLLDQSTAGTGDWFRLDSRYDDTDRAITLNITPGDTIVLEGVVIDAKDANVLATIVDTDDVGVLGTYTESATDVLQGNWTYIRAVKTGTAGNSKVQGYI